MAAHDNNEDDDLDGDYQDDGDGLKMVCRGGKKRDGAERGLLRREGCVDVLPWRKGRMGLML